MADGENKKDASNKSDERFKYIGFDVFPGKAGNIFKSDEEHKSLVKKVMASFGHSEGEVRERCTLLEERVSGFEKSFLAAAAVLLVVSLFLPWFSGHFENVTTRLVPIQFAGSQSDQPADNPEGDNAVVDSMAVAGAEEIAEVVEPAIEEATEPPAQELALDSTIVDSIAVAAVEDENVIPPGMRKIQETTSDPRSLTGFGALLSLGTYGSMIFSSGFILMLSAILLIVYFISCLGMAGFNLYILYGVKKKSSDEYALHLKEMLKYNWYPVYLWLAVIVLAFIGAEYGFDSSEMVVQVGDSYGISSFMGLSSIGMFLPLAAFLILALKGKEI
ncbi:MAG: hypothetical protein KAR42_02685 [candidate division Zixibacteria bacterium]|nr:hypothetical protein [candidate division Zixibacteria bacterium]